MSRVYGGYLPRASSFSAYQSYGALDGRRESEGPEEEQCESFWPAVSGLFLITAVIVLIRSIGGK
ncbi:uncharacterized protein LACBIDRAFT_305041 [Laccaria bicolor S238N-H82]|uniref:Predicted protein n=1 Tax=Laccaria bicolor (strain S238N-H82 / ATCC MYA-4686) TaxID=486041 RepID=B0CTB2_LACBS|nr:uncharacterized protein LACBIDRAFT_305041 [Laccaria bicolor S238N-H82]EDR14466.1 predicted protein [Laccaria bicolor S238N-H82]|eukprot:XP_001875025.1 predicted protein [Laccaria bicolor S238N-H82]